MSKKADKGHKPGLQYSRNDLQLRFTDVRGEKLSQDERERVDDQDGIGEHRREDLPLGGKVYSRVANDPTPCTPSFAMPTSLFTVSIHILRFPGFSLHYRHHDHKAGSSVRISQIPFPPPFPCTKLALVHFSITPSTPTNIPIFLPSVRCQTYSTRHR